MVSECITCFRNRYVENESSQPVEATAATAVPKSHHDEVQTSLYVVYVSVHSVIPSVPINLFHGNEISM